MSLPTLQQSPPKLKVRGAALPLDLATCVMKIAIERDLNLPGQFTVQLLGLDLNQSILTIFGIGQEVVIQMDSESEIQTPTLVGEIAGLEPEFRSDGFLGLTVWGYDRLHHLQRSQKTRSYTRLKDSQIAMNIAAEAGLMVQVKDSEVIHEYLLQANQTDLAFLQERAQLIHYAMFVEDKTLFFQPIDSKASPSSTLTLGEDLLEFYPRLSSVSQNTQVQVQGWDMTKKETILGKNSTVKTRVQQEDGVTIAKKFGTSITTLSDRPVLTKSEAGQIAEAQLNRTMLGLIVGEGVCLGLPKLSLGQVIRLEGLNKTFNGDYYVTGISHHHSFEAGYTTHFKVRRNHYDVD
jgi:uncharacterized protein